jgi:hypothetical protein
MTSAESRSPFFLLPSEVEELTGFKSAGRQCRWLEEKGWRFVASGSGKPIIARKYAEKMLGCGDQEGSMFAPTPNFGAILRPV